MTEKVILTTEQYAKLRGITQRAVQKSVSLYKDKEDISPKALLGVDKIQFFGAIAQLVMVDDYKNIITNAKRKARRRERAK